MKDSIMQFEISKEIEHKYINEINIIDSAWFGISFLRDRTTEFNQQTKNKINPDGKYSMMILPNDSMLNGLPVKLIINIYNWYSVTFVNMITSITKIWIEESILAIERRNEYIDQVCKEVKVFRDKVGAHYSFNIKNKHDNEAERTASSIPTLCFNGEIWNASPWRITEQKSGKETGNIEMGSWDIESSYMNIKKRYVEES